jgi:NAD(P)-dependent dehydrogenase (short-subunit alcohol dehydrogenase family)
VDPATLVVQALVTGASAGLGDTATAAVSDGYSALKHVLVRRLSGRHEALAQLQAIESGSGGSTDELVHELVVAGAVDDRLLADARRLLALTDPEGSTSGKYQIDLREARGVQIGDGNTQHNTFH